MREAGDEEGVAAPQRLQVLFDVVAAIRETVTETLIHPSVATGGMGARRRRRSGRRIRRRCPSD
jgi:hypothetical protein